MHAKAVSSRWAVLAACVTTAGGCNSILGIQEKGFDAEAGADTGTGTDGAADDGAATHDATGPGKDGGASDGTMDDAPEDVSYATCGSSGTDGAVCGAVSYGAWSSCDYAGTCANTASRTRSVMTPLCSGSTCTPLTTTETDTAGCARNTDGTSCGTNEACSGGTCKCVPQCSGKNCGADGCGGSCGSCSGGNDVCNGSGQCICTPTAGCESGASVPGVCAPDDGCGGACTCNTQNDESCVSGACCYNSAHYCNASSMCCSGSCNLAQSLCN